MKDEEIGNLLGGFAPGTLTAHERELLFTAALKDQELFNALADEEVLRELLSDPAARRRLLLLLHPAKPGLFERLTSWMRRPAVWAVAGSAVAALVVAIALKRPPTPVMEMAKTTSPAIVSEPAAAPQPPPSEREEARTLARRDAAPANKMKVAVLDFESGPARAKEADSPSKDMGKTASDLLGKKLDSSGYEVIDRKQVDKALQEQKLENRQLDPAAAASVGRSVGADAVIVGSVKPASPASPAQQPEAVEVNATAINTQNAASLGSAQGGQAAKSGLSGALDQVASSLGQQLQQKARMIKLEGYITGVNANILTFNIGAKFGVRTGERLEVRRLGKPIGRVLINSVQDTFSTGVFEGAEPPRVGDIVANQ